MNGIASSELGEADRRLHWIAMKFKVFLDCVLLNFMSDPDPDPVGSRS
jgi:hypothetical protein